MGVTSQENVGGHKEGVCVSGSILGSPSVKWLWKEKTTEVVLAFLRETRVSWVVTERRLAEEEGWGQ